MKIEKHEYVFKALGVRETRICYTCEKIDEGPWGFAYIPGKNYIYEIGIGNLRWSPENSLGWRQTDRGRCSICSYENFGADIHQADIIADKWRNCAKKAWDAFVSQGIISA